MAKKYLDEVNLELYLSAFRSIKMRKRLQPKKCNTIGTRWHLKTVIKSMISWQT